MIDLKTLFKKFLFTILLLFSTALIWINISLYLENYSKEEKRQDILLQLNYLGSELKNNDLGGRMQAIFPEGFVFTNALYGLSWCEVAASDSSGKIKEQALKEALFAYDQINSAQGKSAFRKSLVPENGIFYTGWNNYLLSKILLLDSGFQNSNTYKDLFKNQCEAITSALQNSSSPFLESYEAQSWPADMCVAMASVKNYDRIFSPKYENIVATWLTKVKTKLDPNTKLIPHKANANTGEPIEGARGCSISLILRLLSEIDKPFALEQYKLYKDKFVTTTFGLPSISEFPKGLSGPGDIDSGPVIFGVGFSGTIVSIGTFSLLGDPVLAEQQFKTINVFGLSFKTSETKRYIGGMLPIADAFISWGRSSSLNAAESKMNNYSNWRIKFHLLSFLCLVIFWLPFYGGNLLNKLKKSRL